MLPDATILPFHRPPCVRRDRTTFEPSADPAAKSKLAWALEHAAHGFAVFPCIPNGKRPLLKGGVHLATTDPDQIRAWWGAEPDANVGVAMGGGKLALDVDPKNGGDDTALELPGDTYIVVTPSGGRHRYMLAPNDVPNSAGKVGPGLDVRGAGGYVLGAGSAIDGRRYAPATPMREAWELADAPVWLRDKAGAAEERDASADVWLVEPDNAASVAGAEHFARTTKKVAISDRGGNTTTYETAAICRDFGVTEETCVELLAQHYNPRCVPPWEPDALAGIVANAYRYAKRPAGNRCTGDDAIAEMATRAEADAEKRREEGAKRSRFAPRSLSALLAWPDPDWLVSDVLLARSLTQMFGPFGNGKSFAALDLALHLAAGREWHGHKVKRALRVAYFAGEGAAGIKLRVEAWLKAHPEVSADDVSLFVVPAMPLFGSEVDMDDARETLRELHADVAIFDTQAHAMAGMDENSPRDNGVVVARCDGLRATGCSVILVHHTGLKETDRGRGHTALPAACDTLISVAGRLQDGKLLGVTLSCAKQRDAEPFKPIMLTAERIELGRKDADGRDVASLVLRDAPAGTITEPNRATAQRVAAAAENDARAALLRSAVENAPSPVLLKAASHLLAEAELGQPGGRPPSTSVIKERAESVRKNFLTPLVNGKLSGADCAWLQACAWQDGKGRTAPWYFEVAELHAERLARLRTAEREG